MDGASKKEEEDAERAGEREVPVSPKEFLL